MSDWTLAELVEIAAGVLAVDGVRAASDRVNDVPNERLVRWYSTIGLVDRPRIGRGRTARYGERHLAQLVAVKRLQAQGQPLAEIQRRLLGATDAELRSAAGLPDDLAPWTASAGTPVPKPDSPGDPSPRPEDCAPTSVGNPPAKGPGAPVGAASGVATPFWESRPARVAGRPAPVFGMAVAGVTLLLPAQPSPADMDAIASAAAPLIDLLASRGLLEPKGSHQ
ncbi:MAG: MerR family transcriptional regulator [Propionibacteriaceae bacterium]|nr:MerR family transcriptional regulator [Propionibacteriaceae bacterium]